MKKIILILCLAAAIPAYGVRKKVTREPLDNPRNVKRIWLVIINNTLKDHTIRVGAHKHKHRIGFMEYKRIKTSANSINVDGKHTYQLDPQKTYFYLGTPLEDHAALYHPVLNK